MEELRVEIDYFHGEKVKIRYLGTGRFEKIDVRDNKGNILYYLQKDISPLSSSEDFRIPRREYFAGERRPKRVYKGWRNSFIEFCRSLQRFRKMPADEEILAVAKELRISRKHARLYAEYYRKLFVGGRDR